MISNEKNRFIKLSVECIFFLTGFLQPSNGHFTVTANVGDSTNLDVSVVQYPNAQFTESDIQWEKQPTNGVTFTLVQDGGSVLSFSSVSVEDAGVYAAYFRGLRVAFMFSLFRLIVRGKFNAI